jgi:L-fuconolactonase
MSEAADMNDAVDAHQHFWVYDEAELDWIGPGTESLRRDFLPADLARLTARAGVAATIAVQARRREVETTWLCALADDDPNIVGVVGWIDMHAQGLEAQLERFAAHPALVGMREVLHDLPDVDHAMSPAHVAAVDAIAKRGLAYDLLLRPEHLPAATALVDRVPHGRFVVDHIAKPNVFGPGSAVDRREQRAVWEQGLRALARRDHVACKLSGLLTEGDVDGWRRLGAAALEPYLDTVVEAFGTERCMIGSDWPVCTLAATYGEAIDVVRRYLRRLTETERRAVMRETALRWYRVGRTAPGGGS